MKKNLNSCADESATEKTIKPASDELNMSAGAEMLIERMKTNPEDFDHGGKFYNVRTAIEQTSGDPSGWISPRDFEALIEAYGRLILEPKFTEWVYEQIFNPKEEPVIDPNYLWAQTSGRVAQRQGQQAQMQQAMLNSTRSGMYSPSALQGVGTWNSTTPSTSITLGSTSLDESMLQKIKNKLGL
jgi:hypothetical protein